MREAVHVSGLLLYEFRQSVRFQIWLHGQNPSKGITPKEGERALADLDANIDGGALVVVPADWPQVHQIAERLSSLHTRTHGHRAFDLLHVATALHLKAGEFLSFDGNQRKVAQAEGLTPRP